MKILLVYPETPATFWSFKDAVKFVAKESAEPPLGLITVASLLPPKWEKRLIDMNVTKLNEDDILWADFLFLSGMNIHLKSYKEIIRRANKLGTKVVAGGPLATTEYKNFLGVDHFILNEAEITLPPFLEDLQKGKPKRIYSSDEYPDLSLTPVPRWDLLDIDKYASLSMQYSRGCPYDCEFCSITMLNGRKTRTKSREQFLNELNALYELGWRGDISLVDDNFIGNKKKLKEKILPAVINWQKERGYPFGFITEATINLADDESLIELMVDAAVHKIFIGIETPNSDSLAECGKKHNLNRDLVASVEKLQSKGMIVSGGFIVGFDHDTQSIFNSQIDFIQESGIAAAMVGLLNAPTGTKLYKRMQDENRLLENFGGNNVDGSMNFIPKMEYNLLVNGYSKIIHTIYAHKEYYARVKKFIKTYKVPKWQTNKISYEEIKAFFRLVWAIGIVEKGRRHFWKMLVFCLYKYPKKFSLAMTLAVYGFHFRRIAGTI